MLHWDLFCEFEFAQMKGLKMKLALIDGNYVAYRTLFGEAGKLDNGVLYGIMRTSVSLRKLLPGRQQVWLFDGPQSCNRRREILDCYKNGRRVAVLKNLGVSDKDANDAVRGGDDEFGGAASEAEVARAKIKVAEDRVQEFYRQISNARAWLSDTGCTVNNTETATFEADDYIAGICRAIISVALIVGKIAASLQQPFRPDVATIVSSDQDLYQCLGPGVDMLTLGTTKKRPEVTTAESMLAETGLDEVSDWKIVKAVAGCTSDNIHGATGVGEKTMCNWFAGKLLPTSAKAMLIARTLRDRELMTRNLMLVSLPFDDATKETEIEFEDELSKITDNILQMDTDLNDESCVGQMIRRWNDYAVHSNMPSLANKLTSDLLKVEASHG